MMADRLALEPKPTMEFPVIVMLGNSVNIVNDDVFLMQDKNYLV